VSSDRKSDIHVVVVVNVFHGFEVVDGAKRVVFLVAHGKLVLVSVIEALVARVVRRVAVVGELQWRLSVATLVVHVAVLDGHSSMKTTAKDTEMPMIAPVRRDS